jgi:UDP-N-acetyl-D-galactosamine dehydrogenase
LSKIENCSIAVVGLGYVGLPLALEFGKKFRTLGYDRDSEKLRELRQGSCRSAEIAPDAFRRAVHLELNDDPSCLAEAQFVIVAVPTPVDGARRPDFEPLVAASEVIGARIRPGTTVIYESTVYPGATEEICIPALERASGLKWKKDFHVGYSPERINPGDSHHTLRNTVKVVAGDSDETLQKVCDLYSHVVDAGLHPVRSLQVAEAAKVIENTQRDLNIALMNELAIIFDRIGLDSLEVLQAAGTKWNFLPFRPGLVGGHCIGVDPYYLTHKAEMAGYHPQVILAGRRINDGMGKFVAEKTVKLMIGTGLSIKGAKVNVLGLTFKENCPDLRNSRVVDVVRELASYGLEVRVHDHLADAEDAWREYGIRLQSWEDLPRADAIVLAVSHREFLERPLSEYLAKASPGACFVDVKSCMDLEGLRAAGFTTWRL